MKIPVLSAAIIMAVCLKANAADQRFEMKDFTKVQSNAGIEVNVIDGQDFRIEAYAKRGKLERLTIDKFGDTLVIDRKQSGMGWGLLRTFRNDAFVVTVALPNLEEVEAQSGSTLTTTLAGSEDLEAVSESGATLIVTGLDGADIDATASSGSTMRLSGTCAAAVLESQSGSTLLAEELLCEVVEAEAQSGSTLRAYAANSVLGRAQSGAALRISGDPQNHEFKVASGGSAKLN